MLPKQKLVKTGTSLRPLFTPRLLFRLLRMMTLLVTFNDVTCLLYLQLM